MVDLFELKITDQTLFNRKELRDKVYQMLSNTEKEVSIVFSNNVRIGDLYNKIQEILGEGFNIRLTIPTLFKKNKTHYMMKLRVINASSYNVSMLDMRLEMKIGNDIDFVINNIKEI